MQGREVKKKIIHSDDQMHYRLQQSGVAGFDSKNKLEMNDRNLNHSYPYVYGLLQERGGSEGVSRVAGPSEITAGS